MKHRRIVLTNVMVLCAVLGGCGADPKPPVTADDHLAQGRDTRTGAVGPTASGSATRVTIDPKITDACKIPSPHFGFESAAVGPAAKRTLEALASCLTQGPLKGDGLKLVGHADPRGELEYNFGLGQRRAGQVAQYLARAGLPEQRLTTTSRGELDARGHDQESWAEDRRVEILLDERVQ